MSSRSPPLMAVEHSESFQIWLTKVLKPLCDADPGALAKYVLALIKKDKTEKELRQSMIDQLDVFLQGETKSFVEKLFEALRNKEYLNSKPSSSISSESTHPSSSSKGDPGEKSSSSDKEKPSSNSEPEPPSSTTSGPGPTASVNTSSSTSNSSSHATASSSSVSKSSNQENDGQPPKKSITLSVTPSALLQTSETTSNPNTSQTNDAPGPSTSGATSSTGGGGGRDDPRAKRDRRDDDRDKRRRRSRLERDRRGSRSRSAENRNKRSRSPRLERDRERDRERIERLRHRGRKSPPPRRYDRDIWDRRRSRSPIRNRSASPRNRSRTPPRYRRPFNTSRSRSRSPPTLRDRSRSPRSRSRSPLNKDKKDSLLPLPSVHTEQDLGLKDLAEKPSVQSVVVRPGGPIEEQGFNPVPPPGNRCRDFDEKGLCMRGELCPFDHGKDPVVLEDIVVPGVGSGGPPGYGARGGLVPGAPGYNPQIRPGGMIGEYYPDSPSLDPAVGWGPGAPQFRPRHLVPRGRGGMMLRPPAGMGPYQVPGQRQLISVPVVGVPPPNSVMGDMRGPHPNLPPMPMHPGMRLHGMRGGRGRGGFDHGRLGAKPVRNYTNCCLEVRKIPREQNAIMELNSHFLRFGKIINIQINYDNDPEAALVTFSSPLEAQLAYKSTEAVLNNRFIRVFWHNKEKENEEGEQEVLQGPPRIPVKERLGAQAESPMEHEKILLSGNNLTKTVYNNALLAKKLETPQDKLQTVESIKRSQEMLEAQVSLKKLQEQKKQEALKMSNDLRRRQQTMMEEQIGQQKKLIANLEGGKLKQEEREETLKILKHLQDSVTKLKNDIEESKPKPMLGVPPLQPPKTKEEVCQVREEAQKEMLDAELDLYNKEQQGGDTIALQMKVNALRAQAKSLGLISPRGRGGFRGRGFRGRGIARGRGRGIVRALRSVDRRPTKIKVTGWPNDRITDILGHLNLFGPIRDYLQHDDILVVDFDSRKCAEVAMANGSLMDDIRLTMEWVLDNAESKRGHMDSSNNGESINDDIDQGINIDDDEAADELDGILNSEILLTGEEDDEDEEDRSWRR